MSFDPNQKRRFSLFPTTLQKAAEIATRPAFKKYGIVQARLTTDWLNIVGPVLAQKALPTRIQFAKGRKDGGTLFLDVATGWALEIQHLEPVILEKIATYFGYRAVERIHITQRPLPMQNEKAKAAPTPAPLSASAQEKLEKTLEQVTDPDLRAALEKLGEGIFRGKQ
ncbi:MAG: DUF721 domain-containing protein [Alphaproteobacteria bacterium]|nr:DUF721 domain-containing protein [Alphaproteobacteria bacterium]